MAKQFTSDNFQQEVVEESKKRPVLVDFFAAWCGPCKLQGPIIDEVAEEIGEKAAVGKLNTEESQDIAEKYGVMSIPNIVVFKDGNIVENMVGMQPKEGLIETIKRHI